MNRNCEKVITEKTAAQQIAADPRPVMIVDTCNFGNIVGLALSGKSKHVLDVLCCLQQGIQQNLFYLVVPQQVFIEFSRPGQFVDSAIQELENPIIHWNAAVQTYNSICAQTNLVTIPKHFHAFDIKEPKQLFDDLVDIGEHFLRQAIIVKASSRAQKWARRRAIDRKRPAKRGKDSFGDCEICGTALSFLEALRKMSFSKSAYFVSENKSDFAFADALHPDLQPEFNRVSLIYCPTITQAYWEIWKDHTNSIRGLKQSNTTDNSN